MKTVHDTKVEKVFASYKGRTLELAYLGNTKFGFKALLVNGQEKIWASPSEIQVVATEPKPGTDAPVDNDDIKLLIAALNREANAQRMVASKLSKLKVSRIEELKVKLQQLLD